jgi:acetylornithine deacetylase
VTPAEILRELVAIPTPSAVSNVPLLEWVREFVQACGWRATLFPYADENGVAKANLIARPMAAGDGDPIELAFVCHTDTVPYAETWAEALELRERNGNLHGCGACDVKGALACFLAAVDAAGEDGFDASAALILTADEEIGCKGMERLLAAGVPRMGAAIVSEPTSLRVGVAGKGYGLARVTVEGAEAHSAFPAEGVSAIQTAAAMIQRVYELGARSECATDSLFDPPCTTVNVGVIEGGSAKNIIAGRCTFLGEWRPIPADPPQRLLGEIERIAAEMQTAHRGARVVVEPLRADPGFTPARSGRLQRMLSEIAGVDVRTLTGISFGSEASLVARVADEVIVMGPGDMHTAHSERECVSVRELAEWTGILGKLFRKN